MKTMSSNVFENLPGIDSNDLKNLTHDDNTLLSMWLAKLYGLKTGIDQSDFVTAETCSFARRFSSGDPMYYRLVIKTMIAYIIKTFPSNKYTPEFFYTNLLNPLMAGYDAETKERIYKPYFDALFKLALPQKATTQQWQPTDDRITATTRTTIQTGIATKAELNDYIKDTMCWDAPIDFVIRNTYNTIKKMTDPLQIAQEIKKAEQAVQAELDGINNILDSGDPDNSLSISLDIDILKIRQQMLNKIKKIVK